MSAHIIYWRGSAEKRSDLIQALTALGGEVKELRGFEEVLDAVAKQTPDLLVADASSGESETSNRIIELNSTPAIYHVPLVFLGIQAESRLSMLEHQFSKVATVDVPYRLPHAMQRIMDLAGREKFAPAASAAAETRAGEPSRRNIRPATPEPTAPIKLDLKEGAWIASSRCLRELSSRPALPRHPYTQTINETLRVMHDLNPWLSANARRVGTLSRCAAEMLGAESDRADTLELVGLMLNVGHMEHVGKNPLSPLKSFPCFLNKESAKYVGEFCDILSKTADLLSEMPEGERACIILAMAAAILEGQEFDDEEDVTIDAQCLVLSELTSRACWRTSAWNPLGAYRVIRELRSGTKLRAHPTVAALYAKLLGDAVRAGIAGDKRKRLDATKDASCVSIYSLSPGMRVARPIESLDGGTVLGDEVRLDGDLIWRLWQLCAIRPLEDEVLIKLH